MLKLLLVIVFIVAGACIFYVLGGDGQVKSENVSEAEGSYWMKLNRKSNLEYLYLGTPGDEDASLRVKTFNVKSGVFGKKPTPLPKLLGREYWLIVDKVDSSENPETAPYFLQLDVPVTEEWPYGPVPYMECSGQCDWELPGYFGLHGVNGDLEKLSDADLGSSGCVRHSDDDITFLYNFLDLEDGAVRYYIEDV